MNPSPYKEAINGMYGLIKSAIPKNYPNADVTELLKSEGFREAVRPFVHAYLNNSEELLFIPAAWQVVLERSLKCASASEAFFPECELSIEGLEEVILARLDSLWQKQGEQWFAPLA